MGPVNGEYLTVVVKSMHNCISENVNHIPEGESGSIGIRFESKTTYTREHFSKGKIITSDLKFATDHTCVSFNSDIIVFNHSTTIHNGYQSVIHCGTVRQPCKFKINGDLKLRSNSKVNIDIKLIMRPELCWKDQLLCSGMVALKAWARLKISI